MKKVKVGSSDIPVVIICQRKTTPNPLNPHPQTIRMCTKCSHEVWFSESSVRAVEAQGCEMKDVKVICIECAEPSLKHPKSELIAPTDEQMRELRDAMRFHSSPGRNLN